MRVTTKGPRPAFILGSKYTIKTLSLASGYSQGMVAKVFSLRAAPSLAAIQTFAELLGMSVDELIAALKPTKKGEVK